MFNIDPLFSVRATSASKTLAAVTVSTPVPPMITPPVPGKVAGHSLKDAVRAEPPAL